MREINVVCNEIKNSDVEYKKFEGQKYLTAPVIIVQEQVLNGELLTANELSKYTAAWNGVPVTVPHPQDSQGNKISANASPDVLEKHQVGKVFNVFYDNENKQLKGEVWINEDKAKKVPNAESAVKKIKQNNKLDVSSGYFADSTKDSGYHNGARYNGKQHNLRPDHLALLPNSSGACSWKDGCGIRANEEGDNIEMKDKVKNLFDRFLDSFGSIDDIEANELSNSDTRIALRNQLRDKFGGNNIRVSIRDVFSDYVVFRVIDTRIDRKTTTYKISYSEEDNQVKLADDAEEVQKIVNYEPINNNEEGEDMKINQDDSREEIISNVLDNDCNKLSEDTLQAMNDEELEFYANGLDCNEEKGENSGGDEVETNEQDSDLDVIMNKLEELEEKVNQNEQAEKQPYIDALKNNEKNPFPEEELKNMCVDRLISLNKAFGNNEVADYSGLGGPRVNANGNGDEEEYQSPTVNDLKSNQGGKE